jgi:hypothetical protein
MICGVTSIMGGAAKHRRQRRAVDDENGFVADAPKF